MFVAAFFLCGPTWPVPDVYEALVNSFVGQGRTLEAAQAYIEELKEQERYVLEVSIRFRCRSRAGADCFVLAGLLDQGGTRLVWSRLVGLRR